MKFILPQYTKKQLSVGLSAIFSVMTITASSVVYYGTQVDKDISVSSFMPQSLIKSIPRANTAKVQQTQVPTPKPTPTPNPSPTPSPTPTTSTRTNSATSQSTSGSTTAPTSQPTPTPGATPTPNPTPSPTPEPTPRVPNPPVINISYPSDAQVITLHHGDQICVVDTPAGGDTSGLQRKYQLNKEDWNDYQPMSTWCFAPNLGLNGFEVKYKNSYDEESETYRRTFVVIFEVIDDI